MFIVPMQWYLTSRKYIRILLSEWMRWGLSGCFYYRFRVCTCVSLITTTRVLASFFVVATDAGQFDLYSSWHFQKTSILSSVSLKNRH